MVDLPSGIMAIYDWMFYTYLGGTILAILLFFTIILIFFLTPALTFLKAKFQRKPIFLFGGRDGYADFLLPKKIENEYGIFKGIGVIGIIKDSNIIDRKSKQSLYLANKDIGATFQRDWPRILEILRSHFPKELKNGKDLKNIVARAIDNSDDAEKNPSFIIKGTTYYVSELANFFPLNIKPSYIESYGEIAKRQERRKVDAMKWLMGFAVLILVIAIAGYMLIGQVNKNNDVCQCNCVGDGKNSVVNNPLPGVKSGGVIDELPKSNPGISLS